MECEPAVCSKRTAGAWSSSATARRSLELCSNCTPELGALQQTDGRSLELCSKRTAGAWSSAANGRRTRIGSGPLRCKRRTSPRYRRDELPKPRSNCRAATSPPPACQKFLFFGDKKKKQTAFFRFPTWHKSDACLPSTPPVRKARIGTQPWKRCVSYALRYPPRFRRMQQPIRTQ